jgi:penicillin-binding protein 2D
VRRACVVIVVAVVSGGAWLGAIGAVSALHALVAEVDRAGTLAELQPRPQATIVFDRHGRPAFSFFVEQRIDVPLASVSRHVVDALVAVEDRRFFRHHGIDAVRVVGAAWRNVRAGRIVQGGSTITQQLARASLLTPERTWTRKMREALIAARLEQRYSKDEILERYLNTVYFGEGLYGIEAAARGYFGKPASDLELHEAALLTALVRSPSTDAPSHAPERARERRNLVLRRMHAQGRIDGAGLAHAMRQPLPDRSHAAQSSGMTPASAHGTGLYFQEEVRRQLAAAFGEDRVLRGGLRVYSTFDPDLQRAAEETVSARIRSIVRSRPRARDLQGSLVALDAATGDVLALVGGRSFAESRFNRATQARRQPGSAFKPIVFAAALERGYGPGSLLRDLDVPIDSYGPAWLPSGEHERAEYTLRRALRVSSNRAAAQLLQQVGVGTAIYYAQRLGIESRLPLVPSLALGTGEVTLLELTAAYTAFANRGVVSSPRLFTHVTDASGAVMWEAAPQQRQALSPTTAYLMSSMLSDVVARGTGTAARASGFRLPAAGKTGTSDDFMDAWFIGYTPHLVAGVWFGLDDPAPIMRDGFAGTIAAPAWGAFMRAATAGARPEWYETPPDVEKVAICRLSGARATDACRHGMVAPGAGAFHMQAASINSGAGSPFADQAVPSEQPSEPAVYEDLFPIGAVPVETCWMHVPVPPSLQAGWPAAREPVRTPLVDDALRQQAAQPLEATASAPSVVETGSGTKLVVQRVVGADGVTRTIVRQVR